MGEGPEGGNKGAGEMEKKRLSSFRPSRPPVVFQALAFAGLGEVEHCSVSDLHSVYYAVTGAPRPRGGLLNSNMHRTALFSPSHN